MQNIVRRLIQSGILLALLLSSRSVVIGDVVAAEKVSVIPVGGYAHIGPLALTDKPECAYVLKTFNTISGYYAEIRVRDAGTGEIIAAELCGASDVIVAEEGVHNGLRDIIVVYPPEKNGRSKEERRLFMYHGTRYVRAEDYGKVR